MLHNFDSPSEVALFKGGKKKGGGEEAKKEEAKKEEIKFDPITPESLMMGKPFGKANKKFTKVSHFHTFVSSNRSSLRYHAQSPQF